MLRKIQKQTRELKDFRPSVDRLEPRPQAQAGRTDWSKESARVSGVAIS